MVKKKSSVSRRKISRTSRKDFLSQDFSEDVKELKREVGQFEDWVYHRRKFLIKFGMIFLVIILILLLNYSISH